MPHHASRHALQRALIAAVLLFGATPILAGTRTLDPLFHQELDRGTVLGASVSSLWQWDLEGLGITDYTLSFGTPDSSLSLDAITVDTWSGFALVPEPSPVVLWLGGAALMGLHRLRRR